MRAAAPDVAPANIIATFIQCDANNQLKLLAVAHAQVAFELSTGLVLSAVPDEMYLVAGGTSSPADSFIFIGFQFERRATANADGLSQFCRTVSIAGAVPNDFFPDVVRRISVPVFAFLLQRHALSPPLIPPPVRWSFFKVCSFGMGPGTHGAGRG